MAPEEKVHLTSHSPASVYQLDREQVNRAATALLKHIDSERTRQASEKPDTGKKNLLKDAADSGSEQDEDDDVPIWLIVTTKKHVVDKKRLKPTKIPIPHPIRTSSTSSICLITADPQRTYKDLLKHPAFPTSLNARITRVLGFSKLKAKYKSFESRRQLRAEHDIFLADDRIITTLPGVLGKAFYKSTGKRPIPVSLTGNERFAKDEQGRKIKDSRHPRDGKDAERQGRLVGAPADVAKSIERALQMALVNLSPSTTTAVQVGRATWDAPKVADNVEAVVSGLTEKIIPQGWRNVRAIHMKGPETTALPVWLASELWVEERNVLEENPEEVSKKAASKKKKRKAEDKAEGTTKRDKKSADDVLSKEAALRKEMQRRQKGPAMADDDVFLGLTEA